MNPAKLPETESTIRFSAKLLRMPPTGPIETGTALALPKDASAKLPSAGVNAVEGTINGFPFRAALESHGDRSHSLQMDRTLQAAAGASEGDLVSVEITRIGEEPECRVPMDLHEALADVPTAAKLWSAITPLARRDWILWISSAKQAETRHGRIAKACSMLEAGKRRPCCFGGLNWLVKDHPTTGGTWVDLPTTKGSRSPKPTG